MRLDDLQLVIGLLVITRIIAAHHEIKMSQVVDARDVLLGISVILGHRDGLLEGFLGLLRVGLPIHDTQVFQAICLKLKVVNASVAVKCLFYLLNISAVIGMMFEIELTHAQSRVPQVGVIISLGGFHLSHFIENHGCVGFGELLHDTTFIYIRTDEFFAFSIVMLVVIHGRVDFVVAGDDSKTLIAGLGREQGVIGLIGIARQAARGNGRKHRQGAVSPSGSQQTVGNNQAFVIAARMGTGGKDKCQRRESKANIWEYFHHPKSKGNNYFLFTPFYDRFFIFFHFFCFFTPTQTPLFSYHQPR